MFNEFKNAKESEFQSKINHDKAASNFGYVMFLLLGVGLEHFIGDVVGRGYCVIGGIVVTIVLWLMTTIGIATRTRNFNNEMDMEEYFHNKYNNNQSH